MGLFNFFKKKAQDEIQKPEESHTSENTLYLSFKKYNGYIVHFMGFQQQGNYAPISAYEKPNGEIVGLVYMMDDDNSYSLSAAEVVSRMEQRFEEQLNTNEINSYVILYHSQFDDDDNHMIARKDEELKAISIAYHFHNGEKDKIALPYYFENNEILYKGFSVFSPEENSMIFNTQLKENHDYFQDKEKMIAPMFENEIGLKIKKSNNFDLTNTWCGVLGFQNYRNKNGHQAVNEHFALALSRYKNHGNGAVSASNLEYEDITLKGILINSNPIAFVPVVKSNLVIEVVNKEINEWENFNNSIAIITGNGKDTFGVWYLATDYAEHRDLYVTQKKLNVHLSGVAFVLDKHDQEYTAYMPNQDLPGYACFDFLGVLIDYKETALLEGNILGGYILTVRLITHPEIEDFFNIQIYATQENMRFQGLQIGMKISGMFQMHGRLAL